MLFVQPNHALLDSARCNAYARTSRQIQKQIAAGSNHESEQADDGVCPSFSKPFIPPLTSRASFPFPCQGLVILALCQRHYHISQCLLHSWLSLDI